MQTSTFNRLLNRLPNDKYAFDMLYSYFFARIVMHINIRFGKKINGEDVAQEFFVKLLTAPTKAQVKYPVAWVYKICDNIALDQLRKHKDELNVDDLVLSTQIGDSTEETQALTVVLEQLEPREKQIILMRIVEGYSFVEIADTTNINVNTIKSLYKRGLAQAQKLYKLYDK